MTNREGEGDNELDRQSEFRNHLTPWRRQLLEMLEVAGAKGRDSDEFQHPLSGRGSQESRQGDCASGSNFGSRETGSRLLDQEDPLGPGGTISVPITGDAALIKRSSHGKKAGVID